MDGDWDHEFAKQPSFTLVPVLFPWKEIIP